MCTIANFNYIAKFQIFPKINRKIKNETLCTNENKNCEFWAALNECEKNPRYMLIHCQSACGICQLVEDKLILANNEFL